MSKKSSSRIARLTVDALSFARRGQTQQAWRQMFQAWDCAAKRLLQAPPSSAKYLGLMADFAARLGQSRRAADLCRQSYNRLCESRSDLEFRLAADLEYLAAALGRFERALANGSAGLFPTQDLILVLGYRRLATRFRHSGRPERAIPLLRRAIEIVERYGPWVHPGLAGLWVDLAETYLSLGRNPESEVWFRQPIELLQLADQWPAVAGALLDGLAEFYFGQEAHSAARQAGRKALERYRNHLGNDHPGLLASLVRLADIERVMGDARAAEALSIQAIGIFRSCLGNDHPAVGRSLSDLVAIYLEQGEYSAARRCCREAIEVPGLRVTRYRHLRGRLLLTIADIDRLKGRWAAAEAAYHRAWKTTVATFDKNHSLAAQIANDLGAFYYENERLPAARALYEHAASVLRRDPRHPFGCLEACLGNLTLLKKKQQERADRSAAFLTESQVVRRRTPGDS